MLIQIHPDNPNPRGISQVVECLKDGGVVIYPTDTIYGIGCDIFQQKAVERIAKIHDEDTMMEYSTDPELIYERYSSKVDIIIDAGIGSIIPSTVVDYSKGVIDIIREGLGKTDDLF